MSLNLLQLRLLMLWSSIVAVICLVGFLLYSEVDGSTNGGEAQWSWMLFLVGIFLLGSFLQEMLIARNEVSIQQRRQRPSVHFETVDELLDNFYSSASADWTHPERNRFNCDQLVLRW